MTDKIYLSLLGVEVEKSEVTKVTLEELRLTKLSPGFLFILSKGNKTFLLKRAGERIDNSFIEKYQAKNLDVFYSYNILKNHEAIKELLVKVKEARFPDEKFKARKEFLDYIFTHYWDKDEQASILDLTLSFSDFFWRFDDDVIDEINNVSMVVFGRANLVATLTVIMLISLGYTSFEILSDAYHASFLLDFGLVHDEYDYHMAQACEKERNTPGEGLSFLGKSEMTAAHHAKFHQHPLESERMVKEKLSELFYNKNIIHIISKHHENSFGTGFPVGIGQTELSDWEASIILFDHLIPYAEYLYQRDDSSMFKKIFSKMLDEKIISKLPVHRISGRFMNEMKEREESKNNSDQVSEEISETNEVEQVA